MDFTINRYKALIIRLQSKGYHFITFNAYLKNKEADLPEKFVILRHDVDLLPNHSLRFAKIQAQLGIKGSYYFRAVPQSWNENVIKMIHKLGHEIGYHYENLTTCNGNIPAAIEDFRFHLQKLRELVPVDTICMHGSPQSRYDSKDIWKTYNYREMGILGEPYFDVDFDKMFYLTDTGRRWDGMNVSIRDNVFQQKQWTSQQQVYHSTEDIIHAIGNDTLPAKIMFTFHPQRWNDSFPAWFKELIFQNIKNIVKFLMKRRMKKNYQH